MTFDFLALLKPYALGALRHIAGGWAIYLVNRGYLGGDEVQTFTGAILFLGAVAFSVADKAAMAALKAEADKLTTLIPNRVNVA